MHDYLILKLVHILSATFLFGTGLGTAFYMWRADVSGDIQSIALVSRNVVLADWLFTAPTVIIQPLTGLWLVSLLHLPLSITWIWLSLALYALIVACWIPVVFIQIRVARHAARLAAGGQPPDRRFRHLMRAWYALGWPALFAMLGIFWLMVFKPA